MNILIVDDDRFVIASLLNGIAWKDLGFDNVFTANNIADAKDMICENNIDLLLSDIDMPNGSGLDLLSWIREIHNQMLVIFLTNYADFSYAKKALDLKSFHYFLKPIEYDKLTEIIKDATKELNSKSNTLDSICEHFWRTYLLESNWNSLPQLQAYFEQMNIPYTIQDYFLPVLLDFYPYSLSEDCTIKNYFSSSITQTQYLYNTFRSVFADLPTKSTVLFEYNINASRYVAVFHLSSADFPTFIRMNCERFIDTVHLETECNMNIFMGIPSTLDTFLQDFSRIHAMVSNCLDITNQVILEKYYNAPNDTYMPLDTGLLEAYLANGQYTAFLEQCSQYLSTLSRNHTLYALSINNFQVDISQIIYSFLKSKNVFAHKLFTGDCYHILSTNARNSLYDMTLYLRYIINTAQEYLQFSASEKSVAHLIEDYVAIHYAEDLNRNCLADILFLDPDYAAKLFKKETGISFNNYLISKRIQIAKDLLLNTELPINTIADQVGYGNYSYFIRLFKKMTQMTPIEYRNAKTVTP